MLNPAHVLETALLILAAFLVGCVIGYAARRLIAPARPEMAGAAAKPVQVPAAEAPLVVAPTIAPVAGARRPTPAERLAAAAGRDRKAEMTAPAAAAAPAADGQQAGVGAAPGPSVSMPPGAAPEPVQGSAALLAMMQSTGAASPADAPAALRIEPAHVAGETVTTIAAAPEAEAPAIEPEPAAQPVRAEDVPEIDERAHVVEPQGQPVRAEDIPGIDETSHVLDRKEEPVSVIAGHETDEQARVVERREAPVSVINIPEFGPPAHVTARTPVESRPQDLVTPVADRSAEASIEAPGGIGLAASAASESAAQTATMEEDPEAVAMRAIEGGWTPTTRRPAEHPVPHPEHATVEVETAMANARSAVAAATAAVEAAVAAGSEVINEAASPVPDTAPEPALPRSPGNFLQSSALPRDDGLRFEQAQAGTPDDIVEERTVPGADGGLDFELSSAPLHGFGRPVGLPGPRDGNADDLKRIKGISPHFESALNGLGIFHFDQIAGWDQKAVVWVDRHLGLRGRIGREKWIEQARTLSAGHAQPARPVRR